MSEKKMSDWMERLVKKYSVPADTETDKRGILNESQLKNLKDGKS